ncbi:MAG TPA: heme o synthase [Candidatus Baltobacteraceae bacterium]|nr:heme o synthase [Candidatus Baltobacteraceae bacterium]
MNSTLARIDAAAVQTRSRASSLLSLALDYYDLGKPRIMYLLLITTAAAMIMAQRGFPPPVLFFWTMLGGALAAMSAGTLNCVYDIDIDRVMRRTSARPLPAGRISVFAATTHAALLGVISFAIFYLRVNHLAAWLSLAGNVYYVVIYTMLLKRRTPQNIVIGGAAGAIPPLVGWAAITHTIGAPAVGLFAIIFLWTPPHFWALALMTETDYHKANVPMLPNVHGESRTTLEILIYTFLLVACSMALYVPLHVLGPVYFAAAVVLGAIFVVHAYRLRIDTQRSRARALFVFSLLYLATISASMVIDRIL